MYFLLIDTVDRSQQTVILYKETQKLDQQNLPNGVSLSDFLIESISHLCMSQQISLDLLSGILCCTGPGGFTSTRIGVAVANAIGYARQIPVQGFVKNSDTYDAVIKEHLPHLQKKKGFHGISVTYDRDPNIIPPKK